MSIQPLKVIHKYLRHNKKFPHVWCAGCGNGIILGSIIRAIDKMQIEKDDIVMISGIGCSSRMPVYVDFNTVHTLHGRALTYATGIKMSLPHKKVIVITGDGDALAIGGNHFIHACRRNIDITTILINNNIYGMTGGQFSPTTPPGQKGTTAPYGNFESSFSPTELAIAAGASFVARSTAYHANHLQEIIVKAIEHKGFSVVEAIAQCPTIFGRLNRLGNAVEMMKWQKERAIMKKANVELSEDQLQDKMLIGILAEKDIEEYTDKYYRLVESLQKNENSL